MNRKAASSQVSEDQDSGQQPDVTDRVSLSLMDRAELVARAARQQAFVPMETVSGGVEYAVTGAAFGLHGGWAAGFSSGAAWPLATMAGAPGALLGALALPFSVSALFAVDGAVRGASVAQLVADQVLREQPGASKDQVIEETLRRVFNPDSPPRV
jgi:hypothetical protein